MFKIILIASLFSIYANAGTRTIDADVVRSSDRTKTWTMPAATGTLANKDSAVAQSNSAAGAASTPAIKVTGAPYAAGSATTNKPQVLLEDSGNTSTGWSTAGTYLGINAASAFTGNLFDYQINGTSVTKLSAAGKYTHRAVNNNADQLCISNTTGATEWCWGTNSAQLYFGQGATTYMDYWGGWISFGQSGRTPVWPSDFYQSSTSTNVATDELRNSGSYNNATVAITNTSATANNRSCLAFAGSSTASTGADSMLCGIHESHTSSSETGHMEMWTRNTGTLTKRFNLAKDGVVTMSAYGAGVANFDSSGVMSSTSTSALLAALTSCSTQGSVLYYNGTNWVCLTPGTSGQYLKTQGAAANPTWANVTATPTQCYIQLSSPAGYGSTNTTVRRYTTSSSSGSCGLQLNGGSAVNDATNGDRIRTQTAGIYCTSLVDQRTSGGTGRFGITVNSPNLSTAIQSVTAANVVANSSAGSAEYGQVKDCRYYAANDDIRVQTDGSSVDCSTSLCKFRVDLMAQ